MEGSIGFIGTLTGDISGDGGGGVTPHVTATAQVDANTGTPTVTVTRTGTDVNPNFNFAFQNLKGETGAQGIQGIQGLPGSQGIPGERGPRGFTGNTGETGPQGEPGESPVVSASATIDSSVGTPSVSVTKTGPQLQPNFAFEFHNLKGEPGEDSTVPGPAGPQGPAGPAGQGVAQGGTTGQFLKKAGTGDYLTEWGDIAASEVIYDNTTSGLTATDSQGAIDELNASLTQLVAKDTSRSGTISEAISGGASKSISFAIEAMQGYTPLGILGLSKSGTNHDNVTISAFYISSGNVVVRLHNNSTSSVTITALAADILYIKDFS